MSEFDKNLAHPFDGGTEVEEIEEESLNASELRIRVTNKVYSLTLQRLEKSSSSIKAAAYSLTILIYIILMQRLYTLCHHTV